MSGTAQDQLTLVSQGLGFIAALDQGGASTPAVLSAYGIDNTIYASEAEMFDQVHAMRTRIVTSSSFTGDRVLGAILFEGTVDRDIEGLPSPQYLWATKGVVPFLKVDIGLEPETDGAQLMKVDPMLDDLLVKARAKGIFGTKMRSVVKVANPVSVDAIVHQQFEQAARILDHGLMPILEAEVDIHSPSKVEAEVLLRAAIAAKLGSIPDGRQVMLKLTLPDKDGFYDEFVRHPKVLKVVSLSGGYSRKEANARLTRNARVVASFSRALVEGLNVRQTDHEFDKLLDQSIAEIFAASSG